MRSLIRLFMVGAALFGVSRIPAVRRRLEPVRRRLQPTEGRLFGRHAGENLRRTGREVRHDIEQAVDRDLH